VQPGLQTRPGCHHYHAFWTDSTTPPTRACIQAHARRVAHLTRRSSIPTRGWHDRSGASCGVWLIEATRQVLPVSNR
jgi:hypothetical protein